MGILSNHFLHLDTSVSLDLFLRIFLYVHQCVMCQWQYQIVYLLIFQKYHWRDFCVQLCGFTFMEINVNSNLNRIEFSHNGCLCWQKYRVCRVENVGYFSWIYSLVTDNSLRGVPGEIRRTGEKKFRSTTWYCEWGPLPYYTRLKLALISTPRKSITYIQMIHKITP